MKTLYSYKDIVLTPDYSEVRSRSDLDVGVHFLGRKFKSVAMPANMMCTIDFDMAVNLSEDEYFYVLHRFYTRSRVLDWIRRNQELRTISISVGVKTDDYHFIDEIVNSGLRVDYITIDIAFGHSILMRQMLEYIKIVLPDVKVIAGNISTRKAANALKAWGADAVKIGLSMGKSCTTYNCTGVGSPMFSAVYEAYNNRDINDDPYRNNDVLNIPIIADGQVREVGDICKALVAGATMVMIGSEFAKCEDSPAKDVKRLEDPTAGIYSYHKEFFGSASKKTKGHSDHIEGTTVLLPMRSETYAEYFDLINEGVSSCMSYAGVKDTEHMTLMAFSHHLN